MNTGKRAVTGIKDSIVKAMNNSTIHGMCTKLFNDPATKEEFCNAVQSACSQVGDAIVNIIVSNGTMALEQLDGEIIYKDERLADIEDGALNAKIKNNKKVGNLEYAHALLIEQLRRNPTDKAVFDQICELAKSLGGGAESRAALERYEGDFGFNIAE